jgi:serine/threonine protein kinase
MLNLELTNRRIGHYHVMEKLGEGGMAVIYKAVDTHSNDVVALKLLRPFLGDSTRALRRFEREVQALSRLSHPNIVQVLGFGEHEGWPYLVMEYVPGGTLKQKIGQPIHWQSAAQLLLPIARSLRYAHENGITHRDIKPTNILLGQMGEPKLSDFGIAKLIDGDELTSDLTGTGMGVGTPDYMAPEQFTGSADPRVDVYALGIVFYELVTGSKPFTSSTPGGVILKKTSERPPLPTHFVKSLPAEVEGFLLRSIEKNPDARFQSMTEVVAILENLAAGKSNFRLPRKRGSHRVRLGLAICAGAITLSLSVWLLTTSQTTTRGTEQPSAPPGEAEAGLTDPPTSIPSPIITVQPAVTTVPFLFQDEFVDLASGWDRGNSQDFLTDYQDGAYRIWIDTPERIAWSTPGLNFDSDIRLEVFATKRGGPDNNAFGLLCRHSRADNEFSFYFFYISSEGIAAIGKYIDGEPSYLANSPVANSAINPGEATNRINADCIGENLILYANGTQVLAAVDSSLQGGDVGLIARTFRDAGTDILFDNFAVAKP